MTLGVAVIYLHDSAVRQRDYPAAGLFVRRLYAVDESTIGMQFFEYRYRIFYIGNA
jgi:hypothetical protein